MLQHKLTNPDALIQLRHDLHQHPEVSGQEKQTAERIVQYLQQYNPDQLLTGLGGTGVAAVFNGKNPEGPVVLFRAELDALPIAETNELAYTSKQKGVGHQCGHDGHMTILTALGSLLHQHKPARGKVILLYQPAEETGAGAWDLLQEEAFLALQPDYVFALHNLPGVPMHQVVVRQEVFAAASTGMVVELQGKSSHAAEPEKGLNPGQAMAEIVLNFNQIIQQKAQFEDLTLLTVIHARLGEVAFGTNPGFATVMATLRSYQPADLKKLKTLTQGAVARMAEKHGVSYKLHFVEEFPATVNYPEAVQLVQKAADYLNLEVKEAEHPFRWSEDFGHFTQKYKGAMFGLGSGEAQPQLHHSDYDFPDELIPTGAAMFHRIAKEILSQ
ncbi:amidohydrolase [Pontibacter diazotrophicus]|uniref:Amidohydrolase n=1 Tax=Pontibacter diazotrophicus TaxID=1400979 RepID=A0A3D8L9H7_9BACT|nr:amidohydrolase [Pontibacter diazotrophicus]RDV14027.1 amidohydrolase [Pontibacter diazotrophicus]